MAAQVSRTTTLTVPASHNRVRFPDDVAALAEAILDKPYLGRDVKLSGHAPKLTKKEEASEL